MTKTQIKAVADAIRQGRLLAYNSVGRHAVDETAGEIADALVRTRKGFDRNRFLKDCGVTS